MLLHNLQLLLQTQKLSGGSVLASLPPKGLPIIAAAVDVLRDSSREIEEALSSYATHVVHAEDIRSACNARDRIVELGLLSLDHRTRIERERVELLRTMIPASIGDASLALSRHGSDLGAAAEELSSRLGIVREFTWSACRASFHILNLPHSPLTPSNSTAVPLARACTRLPGLR